MRKFLTGLAAALLLSGPALTGAAQADGKSIIVLDASGSMWGQIDGKAKLEIARSALAEVLAGIPADTELGLMAYGHRSKGDCGDIELVVPPAKGTAAAISKAANEMKFLGKTPLSAAVRRAAEDLRYTEEKANVILITDGIETCEADPCALGNELEQSGIDFTAHVVGFGLTKEEGQAVACLAENTGGKYIEAADAGSLVDALKTTVVAAPEPAPEPEPEPAPQPAVVEYNLIPHGYYAEGGSEVPDDRGMAWYVHPIGADGLVGDREATQYGQAKFNLPPGKWRLIGKVGLATAEMDLDLTSDATLEPDLVLNAGILQVRPRGSQGGPIEEGAAVAIFQNGENLTTHYGEARETVPAGDIEIRVRVGEAEVTVPATITAGQTTDLDIVAEAGLAVVDAYYVEGMMVEDGQAVHIEHAKKALDGTRTRITTAYGPGKQFTLPPGDYVVVVDLDLASAESGVTVKGGERSDVQVILNAGVMFVKSEAADKIEIYEAKAKIDGSRNLLRTDYDEEITRTAPAGDYLVKVTRGEAVSEALVTVKAGERTEVTIP